ncbi:MAG: riboflavin synthase [Acidobacteriaceae bacterium]
MFTGLIATTGKIASLERRQGAARITVEAGTLADKLHEGDSIAVNGVCLTALDLKPGIFRADLAAETLARTTLGDLTAGTVVNLELPTPAGTPLGGHVVQGHVDATGVLLGLDPVDAAADRDKTDWWLRIAVPEAVRPYVVEKGSIAIEGISLTVARWDGAELAVAIIPHTYAATNLHTLRAGARVNLEADVLMKLALEQQRARQQSSLTMEELVARGF